MFSDFPNHFKVLCLFQTFACQPRCAREIPVRVHTYTHTYIHTYIHTYTHTHTYIHTYIHTYRHTYIHTYIYIHCETCITLQCAIMNANELHETHRFFLKATQEILENRTTLHEASKLRKIRSRYTVHSDS